MSVEIRRTTDRFVTRAPGRATSHSLSFGEHYDPDRTRFGPLTCHDDHLLGNGRGFEDHPHADVEIVSWVLTGSLVHTGGAHDPTAPGGPEPDTVTPGSVAVLHAGSGVVHSEVASAPQTRFVQVWLDPGPGTTPGTDETPAYVVTPVDLPQGTLVPVASGHLDAAPGRLATAAATFWVARLDAGQMVTLPAEPRQHVFVGRGALVRSSLAEPLLDGDAFEITDHPADQPLELTAAVPTELLVWSFTA